MNSSAKSNMYSIARDTVLECYAPYLDENATRCDTDAFLFCIISNTPLSSAAKHAFVSSAKALGYGNGCFFVVLSPEACESLAPNCLFSLIEGIDPFAVVASDMESLRALEAAYRLAQETVFPGMTCKDAKPFVLQPNTYTHILGRDAVLFNSFESMLASSDAKQRAWALLKKLPKRMR